jgi:hypothetical protein
MGAGCPDSRRGGGGGKSYQVLLQQQNVGFPCSLSQGGDHLPEKLTQNTYLIPFLRKNKTHLNGDTPSFT